MLIARSFSPLLFNLGAQPLPTLLLNELHGESDKMKDGDLVQFCLETASENKGKHVIERCIVEIFGTMRPNYGVGICSC